MHSVAFIGSGSGSTCPCRFRQPHGCSCLFQQRPGQIGRRPTRSADRASILCHTSGFRATQPVSRNVITQPVSINPTVFRFVNIESGERPDANARRSASTYAPKWATQRRRFLFFLGALFRGLNATLGQLPDETFSLACGGSARRWRTPHAISFNVNSRRLDKPRRVRQPSNSLSTTSEAASSHR